MQRRALLRAGAAVGFGGALLGRTSAHPTPTRTTEAPPGGDDTVTPTAASGYEPLGRVDVAGAAEAVLSEDGHVAYVAATTGYAIVDVSDPRHPTVLAERRDLLPNRENGPLPQIYDVKQDGDTLLAVGPANGQREPTLMGMLVVDVSDPANPSRRAFYGTDYPIHNCYLDGDTAYLTANGDPIRLEILDVGGDDPTPLGSWSLDDEDERWSEVGRRRRVVHDVFVQDGVAYLAHWDAGTWLLDVTDPSAPSAVSHVADHAFEELVSTPTDGTEAPHVTLPGNSHYVAVDEAGDLLAVGREAWALEAAGDGGPGGIDLFDVTDPASPVRLSTIDPPETPDPTLSGTWTTSHNFELRDGVLYSSWYNGGVKRHDVSDPAAPQDLTWWADADEARFWTARVASPGETFVASSMGTSRSRAGLFVFPDEDGRTVRGLGREPTDSTATATERPDLTTSASPAPTETTASPTRTSAESPGFGALAALAGIGAGALTRRGRRREE